MSYLRYDNYQLIYVSISILLDLHENMQVSNCIEKDISILFPTHSRSSACFARPGDFLQLQPGGRHAATTGHQCQEKGGFCQRSTASSHKQQKRRVGHIIFYVLPRILSSLGPCHFIYHCSCHILFRCNCNYCLDP